jgi:hypothetical protein
MAARTLAGFMSSGLARGRELALQVAIALMLISGITPLAGVTTTIEHLPYGIAVALLLGRRPPTPFLITVGVASVVWMASLVYWQAWTNWIYLVQFVNVLTPLVFFATLRPQLERTARVVFWAFIGFGIIQWFGLLGWAEPVLEQVIPRFRGGREDGFRGVASLESEPARAGFQLLMLFIIGRKAFINERLVFLVLVVSQVVLIRATVGLLLTGVLVTFLAIEELRKRPKLAPALIGLAVVVAVGAVVVNPKLQTISRATLSDGPSGFNEALTATSGGRFLALQDTVKDIATQPLGYGADPSFAGNDLELVERELFEAEDDVKYRVERAARPVSAILNALRTFGVAMGVLAGWAIHRVFFSNRGPTYTAAFWFVLFCAVFYGPAGSEALLIALGIAGGAHGTAEVAAEARAPVSVS